MPTDFQHVAIVGGGFSGTLLAIDLVRHAGPRATLIERMPAPAGGIAYGAAHPDHLLNVRAGNMSALADQPDHFVRWLAAKGIADAAGAFVPRLTYGAYLREMLDAAVAAAAGRLTLVRGDAIGLDRGEGTAAVMLADGRTIAADAAVLAVGNLPPHAPPGFDEDRLAAPWYQADPWSADIDRGLGAEATVLLIGTGLTMVDVALTLESRGFAGRMIALSRRGLTPHRHAAAPPADRLRTRPQSGASTLLRAVRRRAGEVGWREAVDELRPFTQAMWAHAGPEERGRFLRHLRPWWDVHRHRLAPPVADRIDRLRGEGRLTILAGKTLGCERRGGRLDVRWRSRGEAEARTLSVDRVVNCTGPLGNLARTDEPLLRQLVDDGAIRPDAAHLGIEVDAGGRVIAAAGEPDPRLFALGPMTRGAFWEIVAVPDIRRRAWDLARRLAHADWVGGEGL